MMKRRIALLLALGLASPATAGGGGGPTVRYICAGDVRIQATSTGPPARVVGGRVLDMTTAPSASGTRCVGGDQTWWTDGGVAELYRGEDPGTMKPLLPCQAG